MFYSFPAPLHAGTFLRRVNRFVVEVLAAGTPTIAHLPNSGRLTAVLQEGATCWLRPAAKVGRKTKFDLLAMVTELGPIMVDAHLPNRLVIEAWRQQRLPDFIAYDSIHPEYRHGASRFDFALTGSDPKPCLVEVKSAADYCGDLARFPDAPSSRAVKHIRELSQAAIDGHRAAVILLAQMPWAKSVLLNEQIDPEFVQAARQAQAGGVELLAYTIVPHLPTGIAWGQPIPVVVP